MNKRRLQQAAIDLVVAILAGYIVLMAPLPGPYSAPVDEAPRLLRVQALTVQSVTA